MHTLIHRSDFVRLATQGHTVSGRGFLIQILLLPEGTAPRVGFTASKKVGNAVCRNFAKRRLRVLAQGVQPQVVGDGAHPYHMVLVAKKALLTLPFAEVETQFRALHAQMCSKILGQ